MSTVVRLGRERSLVECRATTAPPRPPPGPGLPARVVRRSPVSGQAADPPSSAVVGFGGAAPAHHRDRGEARVGMASATALVYGGIEPSLRHPSRTIHRSRRSSHLLQQKSTLDQPCPVCRRLPRDVRVKAPRCDRKQAGRTVGPGPSVPHRAATIHALGTSVRPRGSSVTMDCATAGRA